MGWTSGGDDGRRARLRIQRSVFQNADRGSSLPGAPESLQTMLLSYDTLRIESRNFSPGTIRRCGSNLQRVKLGPRARVPQPDLSKNRFEQCMRLTVPPTIWCSLLSARFSAQRRATLVAAAFSGRKVWRKTIFSCLGKAGDRAQSFRGRKQKVQPGQQSEWMPLA